uniref:Uncharacterized protein n=1 Tax=Globisporangium ultimum (strain ATCC 200006 / CBS 805.95 / DAOM BR144) TaxID=431595 RepID=K3W5S4_GLOUD
MKKSEPHGRMQRRSSQAFRNPELLASLTLSAEAITIPDAIENATTTAPAPDPPARPRLGFSTVSQMKVLAIQKHRRARKQRFVRRGATPAMPEEDKRREMPDAKSKAPPVKPAERQPIGTFETKDAKWKAVVEGEIEKFMYPSLRLESLYQTNVDSAVAPATRSATSTRQLVNRADTADAAIAMPPADLVDSVMTPSAKVEWQVEKRYQNATQSAPQNGHPRVDEREYKRLQFDHQLETAECLLRKKEIAALEMKKEFEEMARIIGPTNVRDYPDPMEYDYMEDEAARKRAASVYHPNIVAESQLIPRLPQTRKIIKEIQRHTTSEGQIKYYADKQNLFTKWKKLQTSQHHQPASRTHPLNNDQLGKDEEDDITQEPYGALSPRSLFYHECVKRQVLPEPVFSRINDVKEIKTATAEPTGNPMSFTSVAATLIQAVHEKYSDHDDLITMPNGKVVSKKHHLALHLQHFGLGDVKTNALSKSLQHFCSIHILDLSDNRLTDASIIPLLQNLKAASIRPLSATKGGARRLSSIVGRIDSAGSRKRGNDLRKLNLSHNEIGKDGCAQIARFLGYCHLLTHLDLSHTSLGGDEALAPLTTAIECHPTLQTVNLSYNNIGEKGGILLGDMITQPSCGITELNVSWNQICRGGATAIGAALRTNTALKTLNLAMNRCGDDGGEQLAAAMEVNTTLTELDLTRNAFGGRTAVAFGFFLLKNSSLKRLLLQDNSLGAIGTRALLKAVASGSSCEIQMSVHDVENSKHAEQKVIFDYMMPSLSSPFELKVGGSPYDFAVASLLLDAALVYKRCALSGLVFIDDRPKKPKKVTLLFDADAKTIIESATRKPWKVQRHGVLCAEAHFIPSPMPNRSSVLVEEAAFLGLIQIVKRGFSSREIAILLDLVLNDLYLTIEQALFS